MGPASDDLFADPRRAGGRGPACLSHAALDKLALGELDLPGAESARAHLAGCAACSARRDLLARDRDEFLHGENLGALAADALARSRLAPADEQRLLAEVGLTGPSSSWWRRIVPAAAAAGIAAAVLLAPRGPQVVAPAGDGNATKGALGLTVYVLHAEAAARSADARGGLHLGEPLHPGDRIRLQIDGPATGYAAVLAVDAAGNVSVFHPRGPRTEALADGAANAGLLPTAIELDDSVGRETLIALRCQQPVPVAEAVAAVAKQRQQPGAALELPCEQARYQITKAAR